MPASARTVPCHHDWKDVPHLFPNHDHKNRCESICRESGVNIFGALSRTLFAACANARQSPSQIKLLALRLFRVEHDLFGKPASTFPDHAQCSVWYPAMTSSTAIKTTMMISSRNDRQ